MFSIDSLIFTAEQAQIKRLIRHSQVVKGELTDTDALSTAVSKSRLILSLLGPDIKVAIPPTVFADFYRTLFPLMREHGVRRIFAISTMSLSVPGDSFSFMRALALPLLRLTAPSAYSNVIAVGDAFRDEDATRDIDFTLFRVAMIPGESDAESWERDREEAGKVYVGPLGASGWTISQKRAALTRWLADVAESGAPELIGKMPAVSQLAGS